MQWRVGTADGFWSYDLPSLSVLLRCNSSFLLYVKWAMIFDSSMIKGISLEWTLILYFSSFQCLLAAFNSVFNIIIFNCFFPCWALTVSSSWRTDQEPLFNIKPLFSPSLGMQMVFHFLLGILSAENAAKVSSLTSWQKFWAIDHLSLRW